MKIVTGVPTDELELAFIPPFDWHRMLRFFSGRATGGVETVDDQVYYRTVDVAGATGLLSVRRDPQRNVLIARVDGEASRTLEGLTPDPPLRFEHPPASRV